MGFHFPHVQSIAGLFKGQFTTTQEGEDEAPQAPRGVGFGEGVSPPHRGRGLGRRLFPSPEKK